MDKSIYRCEAMLRSRKMADSDTRVRSSAFASFSILSMRLPNRWPSIHHHTPQPESVKSVNGIDTALNLISQYPDEQRTNRFETP
jgi:hypothetical protein